MFEKDEWQIQTKWRSKETFNFKSTGVTQSGANEKFEQIEIWLWAPTSCWNAVMQTCKFAVSVFRGKLFFLVSILTHMQFPPSGGYKTNILSVPVYFSSLKPPKSSSRFGVLTLRVHFLPTPPSSKHPPSFVCLFFIFMEFSFCVFIKSFFSLLFRQILPHRLRRS